MNDEERTPETTRTEAAVPQAGTADAVEMAASPVEAVAPTAATTDDAETVASPDTEAAPLAAADVPESKEVSTADEPAATTPQEESAPGEESAAATPVTAATKDADTVTAGQAAARPQPVAAAARAPARVSSRETVRPTSRATEDADRMDPRMRKPALYKPRMDPGQTRFRPRQPMSDISLPDIHYKNVEVLIRFIDGQGRIVPRRKTRVSAKMQRRVKTAIKQARHLALLPYTPGHIRSARRR